MCVSTLRYLALYWKTPTRRPCVIYIYIYIYIYVCVCVCVCVNFNRECKL